MPVDHYQILEVPRDASAETIRKQYKALVLKHHPDKSNEEASEMFTRVCEAYEVLSSTARRNAYDQTLRLQQSRPFSFPVPPSQRRARQQAAFASPSSGFGPDVQFRAFFFGVNGESFQFHLGARPVRNPATGMEWFMQDLFEDLANILPGRFRR